MKNTLAITMILFTLSISASAQSLEQRKTDSVFALVKRYFNAKQADSIYALGGEKFKKALSIETFRYVCEQQLFPLGSIKESTLISFVNNRDSKYKLVCEKATVQLLMNLNAEDKIEGFLFQPFKEDAGDRIGLAATSNPMRTAVDKKVDSAARLYIQKANTVGLSIGILRNGVITTYNYGETERGNGKLPNANSIFEIGSITKTFTATLLAYYAEEGKVKLTDPITKYLPDSVASNKELQGITLQMLSNHTSGLPRLPDNFENHSAYPKDPYRDYSKQHLFAYLKSAKLNSKPGETYAYSNLAVGLLGTILEKVSGKSFEQMVEEIICKPLGMKSTAQTLSASQRLRFVKVYGEDGAETPAWHFDALAPCGALKSTANNLLTYVKANMTPTDTRLSKAMELTHKITFSKDAKLGLAWHIIVVNNVEYYFHDGGTYGSSSFLAFNAQKKLAVVILSNCGAVVDSVGADIIKKIQ
jgi:CubicO group peptidase (beta-lactamase class C family)